MHEVAIILMRSAPGWIELKTSGASSVFEYKDAIMTIFPDGSWMCAVPGGFKENVGHGKVKDLEKFLKDFAAANPL
jgi:hypothetical protein